MIKKGGQKIVYRASSGSGLDVALKIISDATDQRVLQEINIVKNMNLENTPKIIEHGIVRNEILDEDSLYIVEEYIEGISMRDWLIKGHKFGLRRAFDVTETLLDIEILLEKESIIHRDINPNNIIFGSDGRFYLIDFGLARNLCGTSLTMTNATFGPFTPGYAPNEQFTNKKMLQDVRTDLFQIGVTVYEGCYGRNPFIETDEDINQILYKTTTLLTAAPSFAGDTKGMFGQFINMLMAKNQSQRPDSAVDAMRYLKAIEPSLKMED